jgi:hypothetical protein
MTNAQGHGGRDMPDFGISDTQSSKIQLTDLSELAVRLGSCDWFDRTGTVLVFEDFSNGIQNWYSASNPGSNAPVLSAKYSDTKAYCARLTTLAGISNYSGLYRKYPIPYQSVVGVEVHFKVPESFGQLLIYLVFYKSSKATSWILRIDPNADTIELAIGTSQFQTITNCNILKGSDMPFNVIKIVGDLANEVYGRLIVNDAIYDIANVAMWTTAYSGANFLYTRVTLNGANNIASTCWIDDIIVTVDEPLTIV